MNKSGLLGAVCACVFIFISMSSHAALVDNGIHTTDTNTGLIWLDLAETYTDSYADTYSATQTGGVYENYRVATRAELETLFSDYFGNPNLWNFWGNSGLPITGVFFDDPGIDELVEGIVNHGAILDNYTSVINAGQRSINESGQLISTGLVQVQAVPIPAAIWLFGSGLIGLIRMARRNTYA